MQHRCCISKSSWFMVGWFPNGILAWWIGVDGIIGSSWAVSFIRGEVGERSGDGHVKWWIAWWIVVAADGFDKRWSWPSLEEFGDIYWTVFG